MKIPTGWLDASLQTRHVQRMNIFLRSLALFTPLPLLHLALMLWVGMMLPRLSGQEAPDGPPTSEREETIRILTAIHDFPLFTLLLHEKDGPTRQERWTRICAGLDMRYELQPGLCQMRMPGLVRELVQANDKAEPISRACALFVAQSFDEARTLAIKVKSSPNYPNAPSHGWLVTAACFLEEGQEDEALTSIGKAVATSDPVNDLTHWTLCREIQGKLLEQKGDNVGRIKIQREVLAHCTQALGADHKGTLKAHNLLANGLYLGGWFAEAVKEFKGMKKIIEAKYGADSPQAQVISASLAKAQSALNGTPYVPPSAPDRRASPKRQGANETAYDQVEMQRREALGERYYGERKLAEAEAEFQILYDTYKSAHGPEHPNTLRVQNNLGIMLYEVGKNKEGVAMLSEVLAVYERRFSKDSIQALETRNNLGNALSSMGNHSEAIRHRRHVLEARKRLLGPEHPKTLDATYNLASCLEQIGKAAEAEQVARELVVTRQKMEGAEHLSTLNSRKLLVTIIANARKGQEALTECRPLLATMERVLGTTNPSTIMQRKLLAAVLRDLGEYAESESQCLRALEDSRSTLGQANPLTAECQSLLSDIRTSSKHNSRAAVEEARKELVRLKKQKGPDHIDTLKAHHNVAALLHLNTAYAEAEQEFKTLYAQYEKQGLLKSLDGLALRSSMAENLRLRSRITEAEAMQRQTVAEATAMLGTEDPFRILTLSNLTLTLARLGRHKEALELQHEVLTLQKRVLGEKHERVFFTCIHMAINLMELKRYDEALSYAIRSLEGYEAMAKPDELAIEAARQKIREIRLAMAPPGPWLAPPKPTETLPMTTKLGSRNEDDVNPLTLRSLMPQNNDLLNPQSHSIEEEENRTPVFLREDVENFEQLKRQLLTPSA